MFSVERFSQITSEFSFRDVRICSSGWPKSSTHVQLRSTFILDRKLRYQWGLIDSIFIWNLQEGTAAAGCGMEQIIPLSGHTKVLSVAAVGSFPANWWHPGDCTWIPKLARDTAVYVAVFAECNELQSSCTYVCWRRVTSCGKRNSIADRGHS